MKKHSFREKFSYQFDQWMSRGLAAMIGLLFLVTVFVAVAVAAAARLCAPDAAGNAADSLWNSFMHILDPGNVSGDYATRNPGYIVPMIFAGVCGLFVTSILIGLITSAFHARLEALRHGNAKVLEKNHTLILGYDEHLPTILSELADAGGGTRSPAVVVLCERDRCAVEEQLLACLPKRKHARIICRKGDPTCFSALRNAGVEQCAHVIALGESDFQIIKGILAAATILGDCNAAEAVNISAVVTGKQNTEAARIAGGSRLDVLYFQTLISRIFAQTCRQSGLAEVYQELFDYRGDEIYMEPACALAGASFSEAVLRYRKAAVMGLRRDGRILLNPPPGTTVGAEDQIILIEACQGAAVPETAPGPTDAARIRIRDAEPETPLRILILGYNRLTDDIVNEISQYAAKGSVLTVASGAVAPKEERLGDLLVRREACDFHDGRALEKLLETSPERIIVLSEKGGGDADAHTLTVLLQLSDYYRRHPAPAVVVSEMLSKKNQALATRARVNDFVVGSNLAALVLTQVSQNRALCPLFEELLTDEGNEVYIHPVSRFVETGVPVNLYTLAAAALRAGQTLLGLRLQNAGGKPSVLVNPDKTESYVFSPEDCVIVLAQD